MTTSAINEVFVNVDSKTCEYGICDGSGNAVIDSMIDRETGETEWKEVDCPCKVKWFEEE